MLPPTDVEFKTVDGTILRGRLYPAQQRGPGLVLTPGFNAIKELLGIPDVAQAFQQAGITSLAIDPRSTGASSGQPRNDIDPFRQIDDLSDALSFLSTQATVDPSQMGLWGMSLGGAIALSAASIDPRARLVVAVCPAVEYRYDAAKLPKVLEKCMRDRQSQALGNEPFYLPMMNDDGQNQAGFEFGIEPAVGKRMAAAAQAYAHYHPNRTTLQSYARLLLWHPAPMWRTLGATPALFVVPELDALCPADVQVQHYEGITGPKRLTVRKGRGHMDVLEGDGFADLMELQIAFVQDALDGRVVAADAEGAAAAAK